MPKPKKGDLSPRNHLIWEDYEKARPGRNPILLPLLIDMNSSGGFEQERMKTPLVKSLKKRLKTDLPKFMFDPKLMPHNPEKVFDDYIKFFDAQDTSQSVRPPTPLDLCVHRPVWTLFYLPKESWQFTEGQQYSTENDRDDMRRNFEKIATMDDRNALLLSNRHRSGPDDLKFNLHVTITQVTDGVMLETPIIIDPDQDNDDDDGDYGGYGSQW